MVRFISWDSDINFFQTFYQNACHNLRTHSASHLNQTCALLAVHLRAILAISCLLWCCWICLPVLFLAREACFIAPMCKLSQRIVYIFLSYLFLQTEWYLLCIGVNIFLSFTFQNSAPIPLQSALKFVFPLSLYLYALHFEILSLNFEILLFLK